jgi:outer membrane protein assembly factor BamB
MDNHAVASQNPPLHWSGEKNIVWKTPVAGHGYGSPCLWGDRIFLATSNEDAETQSVVAYDRASGKELWKKELHRGGFMHKHPKNTHASVTPACDGQRVFVAFMIQDHIWATALDLDGKILWQKKTAPFKSLHGYGPSPVIYKSLVIIPADNAGKNILMALRRDTGEVVWRVRRTDYQSFGTPIVASIAGRDQLVFIGPMAVTSHDPNTGKLLWKCDGPSKEGSTSACYDADTIYASGGYPDKRVLAIRADGTGDVTRSHLLWTVPKEGSFVPAPVLHEGLLYVVNDRGFMMCIEAKTGKEVWSKKLKADFSSSPVLVGDKIFAVNEKGLMYVLKAGRTYEELATNDLGDGGFATPVICGDRIYLRTVHNLYCIGQTEPTK